MKSWKEKSSKKYYLVVLQIAGTIVSDEFPLDLYQYLYCFDGPLHFPDTAKTNPYLQLPTS